MNIGTTFSHRHAHFIGLDVISAYKELLTYKFDVIRLCTYWDENLHTVKELLDLSEVSSQKVVITLGMKAPRWPEFYFPHEISVRDQNDINKIVEKQIVEYMYQCVNTLKGYGCIKYWQVENEPLDKSGPRNLTVPIDILKQEIAIVRAQDSRPIITTLWGNSLFERKIYSKLIEISDVIGLDLYYRVPSSKGEYTGPEKPDANYMLFVLGCKKPVWITELQAEPWSKPESMNLQHLVVNFDHAKKINAEQVLLWGCEYWLWRKKFFNDDSWCKLIYQM